MGTRHLIAIVKDGDFRLAQYGQWDGYPAGQGADILKFLKEVDLDTFRSKVDNLDWAEDEDLRIAQEKVDAYAKAHKDEFSPVSKVAPEFSRDTSAGILPLIMASEIRLAVRDERDFAADSLFCEWAYVIDLDADTFEVYEGFQTSPGKGRFNPEGVEPNSGGYYPVTLVATFSLTELPGVGDFCDQTDPNKEEE